MARASTTENSDLGGQLQAALRNEPTLTHNNIHVDVNDTEIVLSGTVASGKQKQTAARIAESFAINRRVADHLTVSGSKTAAGSTPGGPPRD